MVPLLTDSGVGLQFTPTDVQLIRDVPALAGADGAFRTQAAATVVQVQMLALFQAEAAFGSNPTVRAFAQNALPYLRPQLQTTLAQVGTAGSDFAIGTFSTIDQYGTRGVFGSSGLINQFSPAASLNSMGVATPFGGAFGTGVNTGFGTGYNPLFGTTGVLGSTGTFGTFGGTGLNGTGGYNPYTAGAYNPYTTGTYNPYNFTGTVNPYTAGATGSTGPTTGSGTFTTGGTPGSFNSAGTNGGFATGTTGGTPGSMSNLGPYYTL
jgi:hypothetical protein